MKFKLLMGCVLVVGIIAVGCNPERGKTPVAVKDASSNKAGANKAGANKAGANKVEPKEKAGIDFENFEVIKPVAFDGEYNPDGLDVGAQVGKLAPEIDGVDLDGIAFKLSDYRGKVVMLDFYGDW